MARTADMTVPEFTDEQLRRLDELQEAAANFFQILAETDDVVWDLEDIYDLLYAGADMLKKRGRNVRFPTEVTDTDGKTYITEWYCEEA